MLHQTSVVRYYLQHCCSSVSKRCLSAAVAFRFQALEIVRAGSVDLAMRSPFGFGECGTRIESYAVVRRFARGCTMSEALLLIRSFMGFSLP